MAKLTRKISTHIPRQVPEFVLSEHPQFVDFLKEYFIFLESAEMAFEDVQQTSGILQETETSLEFNILLDGSKLTNDRTVADNGGKVLLEDSAYGSFQLGETVTGATSGATTTIIADDLPKHRLFVVFDDKFQVGEIVTGSTSGAQAKIKSYKPNPVQNIQQLLNFRDPDLVISNYLTKFRDEFLQTIPESLATGINKRNLIKNIRSLYETKGTSVGHELFFRILFNEQSETIYPRDNMLRVSDGKWNTSLIMRAIATDGDTADLVGRTITQPNVSADVNINEATAVVENVFKFQIGDNEITEFVLGKDSVVGTFVVGQPVQGTKSDGETLVIKATITGIPSAITLTNDGALYRAGDTVTVTDTGGNGAIIQVNEVGHGSLDEIIIDAGGSGYEIGDEIVFANSGTGGASASAEVAIVNGALSLESASSTQPDHIITEDHIILEDETQRGDIYTGNKIVQESGTGTGDITDVRIKNSGYGYNSLPTLTVTSSGGSDATLRSFGSQIGRVLTTKITDFGAEYDQSPSPPTISFTQNLLLRGGSGNFTDGETITGSDSSSTAITGVVESSDNDARVVRVKSATGTFDTNILVEGATSGSTGVVVKNDRTTATASVTATATTSGNYINEDGHVSETTMKIQDSKYYQDFSYVIKVGRSITEWRDSFQKTIHTAGFYYQGEVNTVQRLNAKIKQPVEGIQSGAEISPIFRVLDFIFTEMVGRRLGTTDDGTSLRSNAHQGVETEDRATSLAPTTRDVTLKRELKYILQMKENTTIRTNTTVFGRPVSNTLKGLNHRLLQLHTANRIQIRDIAAIRLTGLQNQSLDGEVNTLQDFGFHAKTNFTIPAEIWQQSSDSFDETGVTFDQTNIKFDKA